MKQTILILSILISVQCFGQKWYLNNVDENAEYPYEYSFQFENREDTCSYQKTTNPESKFSVFRLFNNLGDTVLFANIKVINLENETETNLISEFIGEPGLQLENGEYRIEVRAINYDNFNLNFEIENGEQVELTIKLGLAPELEVYQIDSKKEIRETEIFAIIECVRVNRDDFYKICSDLKKYQIMMHI